MIKTHKELADFIAGKKVLHLNSFGKDSAVCLEWLARYALPSKIVSVNLKPFAPHPSDKTYLAYQKKRYRHVEFKEYPFDVALNSLIRGAYQSPITQIAILNDFEHFQFDKILYTKDIMESEGCDFICLGHSKYESVTRATNFYKKGLVQDHRIFPIGMMTKKEIYAVIKSSCMKVHPCYKVSESTIDTPSYYKMRSSFIIDREYEKEVYSYYPLLQLDKYRYEVLFGKKN